MITTARASGTPASIVRRQKPSSSTVSASPASPASVSQALSSANFARSMRLPKRQGRPISGQSMGSFHGQFRRGDAAMANWTRDELDRIGTADELQIVTRRGDGTPRNPVTIWVARHGNDLYVRSGYGGRAAWYRGTQQRRDGHIKAGGVEKDVHFEDAADAALNDAIDAAYRSLHHGAQWVDPMVAAEARATTIQLVPRG